MTGIVVGFLGAGNFVFVPLLIYILRVPTRIAIGSNLVIAVLSTSSGFLGKLLTGQIPFLMTLAVVIGAGLGGPGRGVEPPPGFSARAALCLRGHGYGHCIDSLDQHPELN